MRYINTYTVAPQGTKDLARKNICLKIFCTYRFNRNSFGNFLWEILRDVK